MLEILEHFPYAAEPTKVLTDRLTGFGTKGETITLAFSIRADVDIENLEVAPSPLHSSSAAISAQCVQLYVVHVWSQAGLGIYQTNPLPVRELLLKDDRQSLADRYVRQVKHWRHLFRPYHLYCGPDVRLHGEVKTSLTRGQAKQILISVKIPHHCSAGTYIGELQIEYADGRRTVELAVEVLPIELLQPEQDLLIWFRGKLDWRDSQHYLSEKAYRAQLQDIFAHGFTSISISETDPALAQRAIEIVEDVGFKRNVVFMPPFPGDLDRLECKSVTPLLYLSDEMDIHLAHPHLENETDHIANHKLNWSRAQGWRMKSMASLVSQAFARRFLDNADIGHCPGILSYFLASNRDFFYLNAQLPAGHAHKTYYYWHAHMEKPNLHRVLAGVYLWKTGAAGIAPYCYQHLPKYPNSPFNDADEWEPNFHVGPVRKPFRDSLVTYPAKNGSIPTLQWEGFREGITDLRYLATLDNVLRQAVSAGVDESIVSSMRARLNSFLSGIELRTITVNSDTELEPYAHIPEHEYHEFRRKNAEDILLLTKCLNALAASPA